jgi:hypothetical protein
LVQNKKKKVSRKNKMMRYECVLKGEIPGKYLEQLNGYEMRDAEIGNYLGVETTRFNVAVADQSQLRGLLTGFFDLNLEIISIVQISDPRGKGETDV